MNALTVADAVAKRHARPREWVVTPRGLALSVTCLAIIALMLAPLVATVLSSLKTTVEASAVPPSYLPSTLSLESYSRVLHYQAGLGSYLLNSFIVATLTILICLALSVPAAYGLARFHLPGREAIFLLLLSAMMVPYQALLTPLYLMFSEIGLANTHLGLAIVHAILQLPFSIYVMRNSFEAMPGELEEAAFVDGCSRLQTLRHVLLPLARPAVVTVVLFAFVASWNEFIGALIFMGRENLFTIPIMLVGVRQTHFGAIDWGTLQAGAVISMLPCLAIYLLLHRHYVSGFLSGAIK